MTTVIEIIEEYKEAAARAEAMASHCGMLIAMMDVDLIDYRPMANCALLYMDRSKYFLNKAITVCEEEIKKQPIKATETEEDVKCR